jgi:hypothetical protein
MSNEHEELALDWNLLLVAASPDGPERTLQSLTGAIQACGGWVLSRSGDGDACVEIDFEFTRSGAVEMYSMLVGCGLTLSREAHLHLTELCQCTRHLFPAKAHDVVRLHLAAYTRMHDGLAELVETDGEQKAA